MSEQRALIEVGWPGLVGSHLVASHHFQIVSPCFLVGCVFRLLPLLLSPRPRPWSWSWSSIGFALE